MASASIAGYADNASWKIHPIFDEEVSHVIETPNYVYFTSRNMIKNTANDTYFSLFRYVKKGEELQSLSKNNYLNGNNVSDIVYNPEKGYLMVLYTDYNIDLIHNNGDVTNIPFYSKANMSQSKGVNLMTIDPGSDRVYFATDFGYVAINDKKGEIAESRIYGSPLKGFCRMGEYYLALDDNRLLYAKTSSPRLSLDQYEEVVMVEGAEGLYPLSDGMAVLVTKNNGVSGVKRVRKTENGFDIENLFDARLYNIENTGNGIVMAGADAIFQITKDGNVAQLKRHEDYSNSAAYSSNLSDVWNGMLRKGLSNLKKSGEQWSLVKDWMLPNAPATYASTSFANHPEQGLLVLGFGMREPTMRLYDKNPLQLSSYLQGRWKNLAPIYTDPERGSVLTSPTGIIVDPNNKKYVYITSYHNGIMRLNLKDPKDIIHISMKGDPDHNNPGFGILPPEQNLVEGYWNITQPYFDKQGNLWMNFSNWDEQNSSSTFFYCWMKEDLAASTPISIKGPEIVEFAVPFSRTNRTSALPLLKTGNGLIVVSGGLYHERMALVDSKGTPLNTQDDKVYIFPNFTDADGNTLELSFIRYFWEDPATGYVWLCHSDGVCYFQPSQVLSDNYFVVRPKVARNDGTNLADYLLDGVAVNHVVADGEGRKWFSTAGAGIICTSADGREILEEFNTSNSPLPDDVVFGIGYDETNNSLMISTGKGYAEYLLPLSQSSSAKADIRAYPNPVRPEFSGYVTITDIPQGSFVKITDVSGNLIKDLGIMTGFEMLWDISDSNFNRVKSGVYRIMISPSDENGSYSTAGKILVVS